MRFHCCSIIFFFQAEDGIRDLVRSRGLGDVYKRQPGQHCGSWVSNVCPARLGSRGGVGIPGLPTSQSSCLLYTSDAADERSSVDLGGRRIIKKKKNVTTKPQANLYITERKHAES